MLAGGVDIDARSDTAAAAEQLKRMGLVGANISRLRQLEPAGCTALCLAAACCAPSVAAALVAAGADRTGAFNALANHLATPLGDGGQLASPTMVQATIDALLGGGFMLHPPNHPAPVAEWRAVHQMGVQPARLAAAARRAAAACRSQLPLVPPATPPDGHTTHLSSPTKSGSAA